MDRAVGLRRESASSSGGRRGGCGRIVRDSFEQKEAAGRCTVGGLRGG